MKALTSSDIKHEWILELSRELMPEFKLVVDDSPIIVRSADPPSWITFLADATWWEMALMYYANLYVAEIVKEAGKVTWKNRSKAITVGIMAGKGIKKLAECIWKFRHRLFPKTTIKIGLPVPDEYFSTELILRGEDKAETEIEIALFVYHLPKLVELIQSEGLTVKRAMTGVFLELLDDGSMVVSWIEESFEKQKRVIPFEYLLRNDNSHV